MTVWRQIHKYRKSQIQEGKTGNVCYVSFLKKIKVSEAHVDARDFFLLLLFSFEVKHFSLFKRRNLTFNPESVKSTLWNLLNLPSATSERAISLWPRSPAHWPLLVQQGGGHCSCLLVLLAGRRRRLRAWFSFWRFARLSQRRWWR